MSATAPKVSPASTYSPRSSTRSSHLLSSPSANDICNLIVWFCAGSVSSKINGSVNGDDSPTGHAALDDRGIIKPDGSIDLKAIFDPKFASLAKEFLIEQLRDLIGLSRFLIPFGDETRGASVAKLETGCVVFDQVAEEEVEVEEYEPTGPLRLYSLRGTGRNVQRPEDFVAWLVESILGEFRTRTASELDGEGEGRSKMESTTGGSAMSSSTPFAGLCVWMGERVAPVHEVKLQGDDFEKVEQEMR
ncbi:hypothetical protein BG000_009856 [Podila horticola]|nr:hypothetical protein BG000_009856 [Podila horticola]